MSRKVSSTCGYCSTGCNLIVDIENKSDMKVVPDPDYPVNRGSACPKGFLFLEPLKAEDRAETPYIRNSQGKLVPTDWDTALNAFTDNFKRIQNRYGRESVAFIGTGQLPSEEIALLGALGKFGMGMLHGDGNTRQCMATAAVAYKKSFGFDAPPFSYKDFEESDVLVFIGSNPAIAHPIMWNRVKKNQNNPEIILIDPRVTETAKKATQHYPIRPDSLLTFLYGIAHLLIKEGWIDHNYIKQYTLGFKVFSNHVKQFEPSRVCDESGINKQELMKLTQKIHSGNRVSFWWTMGVNQNYQAVACAQAIINLALMTGNIGRPGTGANSITGQANAMGSRIFSNTTNLIGGHDFTDPTHRKKVADIIGIDVDLIPTRNSWAYDQILRGIEEGKIKGLWVICTNPVHSWINKKWFLTVLEKLDYLVVQDMYYTTETADRADLILAAAGCGEKEGTFINSERRIGVLEKILEPPGSALSDFEIFKKIAENWGCRDLFSSWESPSDVFNILKKVLKGQPCDISGIKDYQMIKDHGGIQWPYHDSDEPPVQERRLFEDGRFFHPDGKARFFFEEIEPVPEEPCKEYPFVLLTGRGTVVQWHTQTRTGKVEKLKKMYPEDPYVEINFEDADRLQIRKDDWVTVYSRRGRVKVRAFVCDKVNSGTVFMPMHYYETNILTFPSFDPYSREPSYKYAIVNVLPC